MVANQTEYSRIGLRFVIKFLEAEKYKLCEKECVMCMEKYGSVKEMFTNGFAIVEKIIHGEETHSPVKKKFRAQWPVKNDMLTAFKDMKGPITIDLKKVKL